MVNSEDSQQYAGTRSADVMNQIKKLFETMPYDIDLFMFSKTSDDNIFTQANRQVVRAFRELTSRIAFREFDLEHDLARKWNVYNSPTLMISPERYFIRWLGAPLGEEGRTFLETLLLVGQGQSHLSEQALKVLKRIDTPRNIKVFVSPTCPYCPQQAVNAVKAAIELPELISL
jgi:thioredoxin reductase (NADPH)